MQPSLHKQHPPVATEQYREFDRLLKLETELLETWFAEKMFSERVLEGGSELEFFLMNNKFELLPNNLQFIEEVNESFLIPEVGAAHLEINSNHFKLHKDILSQLHDDIFSAWAMCQQHSKQQKQHLAMIGTPPTATEEGHSYAFMTNKDRYFMIDNCMSQHRNGGPIKLNIEGKECLKIQPECLAMDGLTASFQLHIRVGLSQSVRYYNAAQIISAPLVGACCNSPLLFGKDLWSETRVAIFEQGMTLKTLDHPEGFNCCLFGSHYLTESFFEMYEDNYNFFPRLLPIVSNEVAPEEMHHVRTQNGVVYRWNRPVLDFSNDSKPHLRIEHRSISAGPSIVDMVANAALFYGLINYYATQQIPPENLLPFYDAKQNFYQAAKTGLNTRIKWFSNTKRDLTELILTELIPSAKHGLLSLGIDKEEIEYYLAIIKERVKKGQTGGQWQRNFVNRYGNDFHALMEQYLKNQESGLAVHQWAV